MQPKQNKHRRTGATALNGSHTRDSCQARKSFSQTHKCTSSFFFSHQPLLFIFSLSLLVLLLCHLTSFPTFFSLHSSSLPPTHKQLLQIWIPLSKTRATTLPSPHNTLNRPCPPTVSPLTDRLPLTNLSLATPSSPATLLSRLTASPDTPSPLLPVDTTPRVSCRSIMMSGAVCGWSFYIYCLCTTH
ncbi:MAG: hypothetical protein J3R72DRAFT_56254 [Linnemannia gamsii]|nr:MAG: hypothetical protein J3R72DRAFT_56254 [Linnemannia gamsii]